MRRIVEGIGRTQRELEKKYEKNLDNYENDLGSWLDIVTSRNLKNLSPMGSLLVPFKILDSIPAWYLPISHPFLLRNWEEFHEYYDQQIFTSQTCQSNTHVLSQPLHS